MYFFMSSCRLGSQKFEGYSETKHLIQLEEQSLTCRDLGRELRHWYEWISKCKWVMGDHFLILSRWIPWLSVKGSMAVRKDSKSGRPSGTQGGGSHFILHFSDKRACVTEIIKRIDPVEARGIKEYRLIVPCSQDWATSGWGNGFQLSSY